MIVAVLGALGLLGFIMGLSLFMAFLFWWWTPAAYIFAFLVFVGIFWYGQ